MIPSFFLCVYIYILIVWFVFSVGVYAQLDDAFIKEFGGKDKTMKEKVNWDAPILGLWITLTNGASCWGQKLSI